MLSHQNLLSSSGSSDFSSVKITSSDCHLSYLPLAHIYEKSIIMIILYQGARIGFYNGDMLKLKEDLAHL
jgi:long-chain acyl-CoA synthetase